MARPSVATRPLVAAAAAFLASAVLASPFAFAGAIAFPGGLAFPTGPAPREVAVADMNGDGIPDAVTRNPSANTVSVLLGGVGGELALPDHYAVGTNPVKLVLADVNGDGRPDIVVANAGSANVSVLLAAPDGTFAPAMHHATGTDPFGLAVADVTGDGHADIVVSRPAAGTVHVLAGLGNGAFLAPVSLAVGNVPGALLVADVDGNGVMDLVIAYRQPTPALTVLRGSGGGAFGAPQSRSLSFALDAMVAADFDGDGTLDIAAAGTETFRVVLLRGQGDGTFASPTSWPQANRPTAIATADVNGDGRPDLAVALPDASAVAVYVNPGDGNFPGARLLAAGPGAEGVAFADLDGDSRPDILTANGRGDSVTVIAAVGRDGFFAGQQFSTVSQPARIVAGDMDGDGHPDLVMAVQGGGTMPGVTLMRSLGDGTFTWGAGGGTGSATQGLALADFTGDGRLDVVVANTGISPALTLFPGTGQWPVALGASTVVAAAGSPLFTVAVAAGDLDGDGRADLVTAESGTAALTVRRGNGDGTFQSPVTLAVGATPVAVVLADLNGDGHPDLASADQGADTVSVLLNLGNGTFGPATTFAAVAGPAALVAGDFDGDGHADLAVAGTAAVRVLLGNGTGGFAAADEDSSLPAAAIDLVASDFDGDGKRDLALAHATTGAITVLRGRGDGTFHPAQAFVSGGESGGLAVADFDGDGFADLAVTNVSSGTSPNGTSGLVTVLVNQAVPFCDTTLPGDCDGDGLPNLVEAAEGRNPEEKDNDVFRVPRLFAMQMYRDFLGREGDEAGLAGWAGVVASGAWTHAQVIDGFLSSAEFGGLVAPVVRLYFATFLRVPDYAGMTYNAGLVRAGAVSIAQLADFFTASPEFAATYGTLDDTQFVTLLYANVLGRAPDPAGLAGWVGLLQSGTSRGQVLLGFSDSPEYQSAMATEVFVTMLYAGMLRRTPEPAGFAGWVTLVDGGGVTRAQAIDGFFHSREYLVRFLP